MDADKVADDVMLKLKSGWEKGKDFYGATRHAIWEMLVWACQSVKDEFNQCANESEFLDVMAKLIDKAVNAGMLEAIDDKIFGVLLGLADKYIFDKLFGADWFERLKATVNGLSSTVEELPH